MTARLSAESWLPPTRSSSTRGPSSTGPRSRLLVAELGAELVGHDLVQLRMGAEHPVPPGPQPRMVDVVEVVLVDEVGVPVPDDLAGAAGFLVLGVLGDDVQAEVVADGD